MIQTLSVDCNEKSVLVFDPVNAFTKCFEVLCSWLNGLAPIGNIRVLAAHDAPWNDFLHRVVFRVAEFLVLQQGASKNASGSSILRIHDGRKQAELEVASCRSSRVVRVDDQVSSRT